MGGARPCTDLICCLLLLVCTGVTTGIFIWAVVTGDINALRYDADYMGNRCGVGNYSGRPKAFYPRIGRDLAEQAGTVAVGAYWDVQLYALCVPACPERFDVADPAMIVDYGYDQTSKRTIALGTGTRPKWIASMPTLDLLNRCLGRDEP